jgi:hypothetical protein
MIPRYQSLEFVGPRKSLFYFIVGLSALALICTAGALLVDFVDVGGITPDNLVLQMSSGNGTIAETLTGAGHLGALGRIVAKVSGVSWLLSSAAWVYAFLSWREFMKGERPKPGHVFLGFLCAFTVEMLGILAWPVGAGAATYAFGVFQLFLAGYICVPVIMELRGPQPS